ncbi:MAG: DNA-directed RNA polymerase [Candidatus Brockarchaeota archaeon]|nr:DNA-directed RNA polymerase [Candidatus Brockarchaeota archaeon]
MFKLLVVEDTVRIPPPMFGKPFENVVKGLLAEKYEGTVHEDLGYVIAVLNYKFNPVGKLMPGDGGSYHQVTFELLTFVPELQEVLEGEVVEIEDFGAFVRIGPVDSLLHVSQVADDYMSFDGSQGTLSGRETGRVLRKGDVVRVRIVAVSIGKGTVGDKVGVTARQPFLGKIEWIEEDLKKAAGK